MKKKLQLIFLLQEKKSPLWKKSNLVVLNVVSQFFIGTMSEKPPSVNAYTPSTPVDAGMWERVSLCLQQKLGEAAHKSWISPIAFKEFVDGRMVLAAPTRFLRDWVRNNCETQIKSLCRQESDKILGIDIVVVPQDPSARVNGESRSSVFQEAAQASTPAEGEGQDDFYGVQLDPRFTFENFVVGKSNEFAFAAAQRVAEATEVTFNPLFLYGGVGLGKTHLMNAIAWHIREKHPERKVIYMSAEKFMYHFIRALRFKNAVAFKEAFRSVDVLMIDDVQFISGKDSTQEEFFHTFNAIVDQNRQVIVSADKSPSDLEGMEERLKSRLGWGLVADIHPTTYELRMGILEARVESLKADVPREVLAFLAQKITSNVRELEGALNRLVAHGTLVQRQITMDLTLQVLKDLVRANDRQVTVEEIQKVVSEHFSVKVSDMHSSRRHRGLARPRQVAMYLCKTLTTRSFPEIGRKFGGRDHTTVLHAVKKVEELKAKDAAFNEDVEVITRRLQG